MNCDDLNNFLNKSDFKTEEDALTSLKEIEELVKNDKQLLLQTIRFFRRKGFANSIEMLLNTFHTHIDCEYIIKLKMENAMWARHYVKVKTYADELVDSPKFNMDANIALGYYYINDNNFIDAYNIINDKLKLRDICDEINQSNSSKNSNGYNKEAAKLYIYYLKKIACEEKKILRVSLRFLAEFKDAYFLNAMIDYFISSNGLDKLSQIINEYVYLIPEGTTKTEIILKYKIITNDHLSFKNYIEDFYKLTNIQGLIKIIDFINKIKCFTDTNNFANCILEFIFEKIEDLTELPVKELEFIYEFSIDFNYVKLATLIEEFLESNFKHLNLDERNTISTVYMSYYLEQIYNYCFDKDIKLSIWIYPLLSRIDNLTAFEKSLSSKFYTKRNFCDRFSAALRRRLFLFGGVLRARSPRASQLQKI